MIGDDSNVPYDEGLAERIRTLLADEAGVTEMSMFGGLAFLIDGNMAVAASGQGGLMVGGRRSRPPSSSPSRMPVRSRCAAGR